ncbi:MAG: hypothetical protein HRT64_00445 [Erythrobacter sp.]|nr:hypothetical protein [Erythrobacter sp.]
MKIGYIVHNLNDPAVERRCQMLERGGAEVALAGFCRDDSLAPAIARRNPMQLGASADAAMVQRALMTLRNVAFHSKLAAYCADCDAIMTRNLEQLAIASAFVGQRALIYECLDIHRSLTATSAPARAVQFVENQLLPRVDLLLTSSPAFLSHHFDNTALAAPSYLIENKLLVEEGAAPVPRQPTSDEPIVIGWFGMLRCKRTLAFLSDLTARSNGRITALICGKPSPAELPGIEDHVAATPGLTYTGPYTYADLPDLYGRCHFAWAIDWFEEGLNSSWLLPNRIYEAIAHGAVPIALANVEVGRWLERHAVGLRVKDGDDARDQLLLMPKLDVRRLQAEVAKVDARAVIADSRDCEELVQAIMKASVR